MNSGAEPVIERICTGLIVLLIVRVSLVICRDSRCFVVNYASDHAIELMPKDLENHSKTPPISSVLQFYYTQAGAGCSQRKGCASAEESEHSEGFLRIFPCWRGRPKPQVIPFSSFPFLKRIPDICRVGRSSPSR